MFLIVTVVLGELVEPLQVSCTSLEDYQNWVFQLQQVNNTTTCKQSNPSFL